MKPHGVGKAANVRCCGRAVNAMEVRGLYDGGAFWQCVTCGTNYRRWPADDPRGQRVAVWAAEQGVTLQEPPR